MERFGQKFPFHCSCCSEILINIGLHGRGLCENYLLVDFLLSDNSELPVSLCSTCLDDLTIDDYPAMMEQVRQGWEREMQGYSWRPVEGQWKLVQIRDPWSSQQQAAYKAYYWDLTILKPVRYRKADLSQGPYALRKTWESDEARYCCPDSDVVIGIA